MCALSPGYAGAEAQGIYTTAGDASRKRRAGLSLRPGAGRSSLRS
ncbi:hypothetical protein [Synechococcus sp. CBW1006]|nr:hypothetical protein [Synechococcus sp. CBW1006]